MQISKILNKPIEITRKTVKCTKKVLNYTQNFNQNIGENYYEKRFKNCLNKYEKSKRFTKYSTKSEVSSIEKDLAQKGIDVRFKNNLRLAKFVQKGLKNVKNEGYDLPNTFIVVPSFLIKGASGATIILDEIPNLKVAVLLTKKICKNASNIVKKHNALRFSTDNEFHSLYHEIGHWLHFKNTPDLNKCLQIWQNADTEMIKKTVSTRAIDMPDGTEFIAEVFAGLINHQHYNDYIMNLYDNLGGPTVQKKYLG